MGLFRSKAAAEMDRIILRIDMNMSNNYKDAAQENFKDLEALFEKFTSECKLKDKTKAQYEKVLNEYREKLKGYAHKDQKPYWT